MFHGLEPAELAALASVFVYEPRTDTASVAEFRTPMLGERWEELDGLWKELVELERKQRLTPTRRPDPGFGVLAHDWASGVDFEDLAGKGMAPGDFVRVSRQLVDLLKQLRDVAPELRESALQAVTLSRPRSGRSPGGGVMPRWLVAVNRRAGRSSTSPGSIEEIVRSVGLDYEIVGAGVLLKRWPRHWSTPRDGASPISHWPVATGR